MTGWMPSCRALTAWVPRSATWLSHMTLTMSCNKTTHLLCSPAWLTEMDADPTFLDALAPLIFSGHTHPMFLPLALWLKCPPLPASMLLDSEKPAPSPQGAMNLQMADCTIFRVTDQDTGTSYLIDSGAEVSILPRTTFAPALHLCSTSNSTSSLYTMNRSPLPTCGTLPRILHFAGHPIISQFLLAPVKKPIIGADFLRKHLLLVDISGCRLLLPGLSCSMVLLLLSGK